MSLRAFLYASDVLRLQTEDRFHVETPAERPAAAPGDIAARNTQAMDALMGMTSGVQGAPGARRQPRRARR
jgi:hypothetical protein